ncbi:MAG: hypothetical protein ACRDDH_14510 [Cetobacterium sp.]|uniref:hypothetical protein n=1 Tax=Cetobacterium sp. TaxID=2071632 RepID=UPI003EE50F2D
MIVDSIITGVTKYFTSTSVNSLQGYRKISLDLADTNGVINGQSLEIDATTEVNVVINKQVMQHASESKKVYMDGTKINPVKMNITGHISTEKLVDLQRYAEDDKWMYVSMTKDMGGSNLNMTRGTSGNIGRAVGTISDFIFGDVGDANVYNNCKLYVISNLSITDEGFKNTVAVDIELTEAVMFASDTRYKFGVKQVDITNGGRASAGSLGNKINREIKHKTIF